MTPIHIIGQPGAGKTTLIVELVRAMGAEKFNVGTIKHSAHAHELDKKGKDSYLHRKAGAAPVTMMTRDMAAVYFEKPENMTPQDILDTPLYENLDIVLIEGWISGPYDKIEVWRPAINRDPLFPDVPGVRGLVYDDGEEAQLPERSSTLTCFKRSRVADLTAWILETYC